MPTPLHLAGLKPGGGFGGFREVYPEDLLQENQNILTPASKETSFSRDAGMWEWRLFWQVVACDKAKVLLLVQLVCCSWYCPLQKPSLPATSNCKMYFMQCCCVHFKSDIGFCFSLKSTSILIKLRSNKVAPLFLLYYSLFSILGWFLDA